MKWKCLLSVKTMITNRWQFRVQDPKSHVGDIGFIILICIKWHPWECTGRKKPVHQIENRPLDMSSFQFHLFSSFYFHWKTVVDEKYSLYILLETYLQFYPHWFDSIFVSLLRTHFLVFDSTQQRGRMLLICMALFVCEKNTCAPLFLTHAHI